MYGALARYLQNLEDEKRNLEEALSEETERNHQLSTSYEVRLRSQDKAIQALKTKVARLRSERDDALKDLSSWLTSRIEARKKLLGASYISKDTRSAWDLEVILLQNYIDIITTGQHLVDQKDTHSQ